MEHKQTKAPAAKEQFNDKEFENFRVLSPGRLVAKRFFRSKLSIIGLITLGVIFIFSIFGPMAVDYYDAHNPYGYGLTKEKQAYLAALKNGGTIPEPVPENTSFRITSPQIRTYHIERRAEMLSTGRFEGPDGHQYSYYDKSESALTAKYPPDRYHLLGTDVNGMDAFVRLMYGGRMSLKIAFIVVALETLIGVVLGCLAGYYGKWVDQVIMRVVDVLYCLPGLPILLILSAIITSMKSISADERIYWLMGALTLLSWISTARLVRGQILLLREQEYMMAAEAAGLPAWRKLFVHLLPNVLPQIIVSVTSALGGVILYESTLSYLNLGVQFPYAAWGTMIAQANPNTGQDVLVNYPNLWIPAGILIVATVLAFAFVGDGLRDAFDPKARR